MTRFETILVPVDFSDHSKEALDTAIPMANLFGSTGSAARQGKSDIRVV